MITKRLLAFAIDYLLLLLYISVLLGLSLALQKLLALEIRQLSPVIGQIIGLISLTIPVFLYCFLSESGQHQATFGKRRMNIKVLSEKTKSVLWRNVLKFLPWEVAHTGIHWMLYYMNLDKAIPIWIWIILIVPQVTIIFYLASIVLTKGKSSLYDNVANTVVQVDRIT